MICLFNQLKMCMAETMSSLIKYPHLGHMRAQRVVKTLIWGPYRHWEALGKKSVSGISYLPTLPLLPCACVKSSTN